MIRNLFRRPVHGFWWLLLWAAFVFAVCMIGIHNGAFDGAGTPGYGH